MALTNDQPLDGDEFRNLIVSWIRGNAVDDDHSAVETHHPHTCEWLFQDAQFSAWIKATHSTCLLYSAPPGAGKTVSASAVASYLADRGCRKIAFHFSFSNASKRTTITVLRTLALELLNFHESIPDTVQQLYESDTESGASQLSDVTIACSLVKELTKQISRVHIILDGLDECRDRKNLLPTLGSLLEAPTFGIVKWFLTSRPECDIRREILRHTNLDVQAPEDSIKRDIHKFLNETHTNSQWAHKIDDVVEKSGGNFLWATMALRVLNDTSFTDEKHLARELEKFPKDLNGLYLRDLHRLSKRKLWQQELARKMFIFIVASVQPLRLSELSDALTVSTSPDSPQIPHGQPEDSLLEELSSGLVIFDRSLPNSAKDPFLRFTHKSVHDFFLQILTLDEMDELGIPTDASLHGLDEEHFEKRTRKIFRKYIESTGAPGKIERFFTSTNAANAELGQVCMQYLANPLYNKPGFQKELLEHKDHAFLKYAAVFWHAHFSMTRPKAKISHQVESFMETSAFWHCVTIQSIVAPHLYAIYYGHRSLRYFEAVPVSRAESRPEDINYASPVPNWMKTPRVEDFDSFITHWCRVLNSCPGNLSNCYMDEQWSSRWPSMSGWLSNRVQCHTVHPTDMTMDDLISREIQRKKQRQSPIRDVPKQSADHYKSEDGIVQTRFYAHECGDCRSPYCLECLTTFPTKLVMENEIAANPETGLPSPPLNTESVLSEWDIISYTSSLNIIQEPVSCQLQAVAVHWKSNSKEVNDGMQDQKGDSVSTRSSSESESDSDSDSEFSEFFEDQDAFLQAHQPIRSVAKPTRQHCLLITRENARPITYFWKSTYGTTIARGSFHPTEPWVLWSPVAHVLCRANTATGLIEETELPEPPEIDFASTESLHKELYISEDGNRLFYLVLAVVPASAGVRCRLCITPLKIISTEDDTFKVSALESSSTLSFMIAEALETPFILVAWKPDYVYVALPPLAYKPKIVRLSLELQINGHSGTSAGFQTTPEPIFFPATTPYRHPKLSVDQHGGLALALAAQLAAPHPQEIAMSGPCEKATGSNKAQGPVVISWSPEHFANWKDWNELTDGNLEQYSSLMDKAVRLRGSYVASDQQFHVAIRSSLNYSTKRFISCY